MGKNKFIKLKYFSVLDNDSNAEYNSLIKVFGIDFVSSNFSKCRIIFNNKISFLVEYLMCQQYKKKFIIFKLFP